MKKLLALVLALVMSMSLVTISNAAFKDADKIDHTEAVEVMNALGVINGMPDGSFNPAGNVTRAEMAKMISIVMLGNIDADAFKGTVTDLTDINTHWAEGFIKYCYSQGVIAGRGDGTFAPNANVTAVEAAKMLLVAIGYNATVQGYVGSDWTINVIRDAQLSKFFDKLTLVSTKVLTRDEAAQMIYNAVKAKTIEKSSSVDRTTGNITDIYNVTGDPLLTKTFNAKEYVGVMDSISYSSSNSKYSYDGTADFKNKANNADIHGGAAFVSKTDYSALEAEEVAIIEKTETNGDKTVLGIYATGKSVVVTSAVSALEADGAKLKVNGTKYECEGSVSTALVDTDSYDTVKLVDSDANGKLDKAVRTTITPVKVTYVSSEEIIAGSTYKFADNKIASGLAKKDYVTVVKNADDSYTIEKLDAITGKVDGVKTINGEACVRVNGTWYAKHGTTMNIDTTYTFYAVNGVVVSGSVDADSANIANLIMVLATDTEMLTNKAMVMDASGATKTVTIDSAGVAAAAGEMYTFTETEKGYKLTAAATIGSDYTWAADGTVAAAGTPSKVNSINSKLIADNAVIFVKCTDGGKIVTGKQFKNLAGSILDATPAANKIATTASGSYTSTVNGLERVSYAGVIFNGKAKDLGVTSGNELYAYVTSASYTVANSYTTYTIWNGESNLTVTDKGATSVQKGDIITYDAIDGDYITGVSKATLSTPTTTGDDGLAYVAGIEGKYIYLDGTTNKYEITSDTKYLFVDSNASTADEIGKADGELVLADKYADDVYMDNVTVLVDSSAKLELIVVDVKNNMTHTGVNAVESATGFSVTNATVTLSKTSNLKIGDAIEITVTATGAVSATSKTVNNAKLADGSTTINIPAMTEGQTYKVTVFKLAGDVSFT